MHEDNLFIPWSMGRTALVSDDGFVEAISKINKWSRREFEKALIKFIDDGDNEYLRTPNGYWGDWESCNWFEDNNNKVMLL